eukprot:m.311227 g.311227  ORF g.311227 m.311227 type:complete len:338 (+) comp20218_c1_seq1:433-1446(+)
MSIMATTGLSGMRAICTKLLASRVPHTANVFRSAAARCSLDMRYFRNDAQGTKGTVLHTQRAEIVFPPIPLSDKETHAANDRNQAKDFSRNPTLGMLPFVGAASAAKEPILGETAVWLLSSCVGVGSIKLGLPGVAAQTVFFAPLGAMKEISKKGTTGQLPLLPYSAMAASGYLWMVYGFLNDNAAIWLPNVPALAMGVFYTGMFCKYAPADANWLPGTKGMHVAGIAASCAGVTGIAYALPIENAIFALGSYGTAVVIVMFAGPLSAMKTVIEEKSTQSLPFAMTVATFVNCSLWTVYGTMVISDFFIWFPNAMGLASSIVQLGLFAKFGFHGGEK